MKPMRCPHCNAPAAVRSSRELSPLYRERVMQCTNDSCGFIYVVGMEVVRTLQPSTAPNHEVDVPQSTNPCAGVKRAAHA